MNQLWQAWYGKLSDDRVSSIIDICERYPIQPATIGDTSISRDDEYRRSEIRWVDSYAETELVDLLWFYILEANRNSYGFHVDYLTEIQYTIYNSNNLGKYDWHQDVFWANNRCYDRKLSITVQLSDSEEYEGGDFQFDPSIPPLDPNEIRRKGTVIVFPSFLSHRVTPVTKGIRKSLVTWAEGPKFR